MIRHLGANCRVETCGFLRRARLLEWIAERRTLEHAGFLDQILNLLAASFTDHLVVSEGRVNPAVGRRLVRCVTRASGRPLDYRAPRGG